MNLLQSRAPMINDIMTTLDRTERPRRVRRVRALLLGFGIAAIGVELALQAVTFVLWAASGGDEARPAGCVVLCLGDSLTFGLGAEPAD